VTSPADLPDYTPIPQSALGPALNEQGYYVGRVERNLYWVTDGVYHSAFLTTPDGVVLFDAPPSIGGNIRRAVDEIAAAPAIALSYPWTHLISGHLGRPATRDDVAVHQQYIADIDASAREALESVDPVPFYTQYWPNAWAGVKAHLDTVTERAAAPIVAKYTGVLAAADIEAFTTTTTFQIMQSYRLDRGHSGPVHP
jgi:hypothetical protein